MLTRYTLLNFLLTVLIGSAVLTLGLFIYEGGFDGPEGLLFALPCMLVSGLLGAPTLVAQIITINTGDVAERLKQLRRSHGVQAIGAVITFALLALFTGGQEEVNLFIMWAAVTYGGGGLVINFFRYRKFVARHDLERMQNSEILDLELGKTE